MKTNALRAAAMLLALLASAVPARAQLAVRAGTLYTMAGPPIEDGVVVVVDGRITAVGPASAVEIPAGARVHEAAVVLPGLVDGRSAVGLAGWLNYDHDNDELDRGEPIQPELRALDAYDPRDPLVAWLRSFGVTTLHTGHAPGTVVSGQTMVVKTRGDTIEEAVLRPEAMVVATLGQQAVAREGSPGTRAKAAALLRASLAQARHRADERARRAGDPDAEPLEPSLRLDVLERVLAGELPLLVEAHRVHDIDTALRLAQEHGFRLVLSGAAEAWLIAERLREAGVPILLHPTMARAAGEAENLSLECAARLHAAGVPFALQSHYEAYVPRTRCVLFEAGVAAAYGLPRERALAAITIEPARLLGVAERVGSLEVGKDGDLALYDGDPLETTTHCIGVFIEGELVSDERR